MKFTTKKFVAVALCSAVIACQGIYTTPVFAENTETIQEMQTSSIPAGNAYIPKGTVLAVELTKEVSSKKAKVGDDVPLKLVENLIVNDIVVIPAGTEVKGVVTESRKAGGFGRGGKLEISIVSVKTLNGIEIPLEYTNRQHGAGDGGAVAVAAAVTLVGGIFMKGKNVVLNEGLQFDAEVTNDTDLKVSLENLKEEMDASKPHGVSISIK